LLRQLDSAAKARVLPLWKRDGQFVYNLPSFAFLAGFGGFVLL